MPLDRIITLEIRETLRGNPFQHRVWADRRAASVERIQESLGTASGTSFVDFYIRWRADVEAIIPALLTLRDENDHQYTVSGITPDERRRSFLTIHAERTTETS